jgi:small neutral amino acid transporter SnatA (MarC family)
VDTAILPLAITMMAGPQILSAFLLITGRRPVSTSAAFVAAVALGSAAMVAVWMLIGGAIGDGVELSEQSQPTTAAKVIQLTLVGLLIARA